VEGELMADRPILFSAPMVRALLAGTKTQTRRVVKPQPDIVRLEPITADITSGFVAKRTPEDERHGRLGKIIRCPYGLPGDRLWVRESLKAVRQEHGYIVGYAYKADDAMVPRCPELLPQFGDSMAFAHLARPGGVPAIHMPRWASRISLEVTGVRVERLQAISEADAIAEGTERRGPGWRWYTDKEAYTSQPITSYRSLWESINGGASWDANPWLWVVEFRRAAEGGA
jgi:hypothetical protein